jgi:hypothetical protein
MKDRKRSDATPVAPMAAPTPLAKSQRQKPMTDAERDGLIRNTPLRSGPRNDDLEGDTPEMFAARQKAEAGLRDIAAGKADDGGKALRDFGNDGKETPDPYASRMGTPEQPGQPKKEVDQFVVHGGYKVNPDDPRVAKTRGMSGKDRDAALRWIAVEDANKNKELERAEIAAGLRAPPEDKGDGKGTMSKIGQALKSLGTGFSGRSYDDTAEDTRKQLADQKAQFAEINSRTSEIQKYIDESRKLGQQSSLTKR